MTQSLGIRKPTVSALRFEAWSKDPHRGNPETGSYKRPGFVPELLADGSANRYYPYLKRGLDETTMQHTTMVDPKDGSERFGVQKAPCEEIARAAFGEGSILVRPSYIVGPGDTSDRFSLQAAATREGRPNPGAGKEVRSGTDGRRP